VNSFRRGLLSEYHFHLAKTKLGRKHMMVLFIAISLRRIYFG